MRNEKSILNHYMAYLLKRFLLTLALTSLSFLWSDTAYIVGTDGINANLWIRSPGGSISAPTTLTSSDIAYGIDLAANGSAYIAGTNSSIAELWIRSPGGAIGAPTDLTGGIVARAIALSPNDIDLSTPVSSNPASSGSSHYPSADLLDAQQRWSRLKQS